MVILMRQPSKAVLILNTLFVIMVVRIYCCHPASKKQCLSKETVAQLTTDKSLSFMKQNVIHCTNHSIHMMDCVDHWSPNHKKYIWPLKDHYEPLRKQANHSINKDKRRIRLDKSTLLTVDIIIDARCHHSWPYNPYHRIADCLIFIIPALQNYIDFHFPKRKTPWARTRTKIAMIVDEASEMLCENGNKKTDFEGREVDVSKDDQCILWDFQMLFRSRYYFQCVKISIFHKSIHWYRKLQHTTVVAKEVIWLQAQKNPFALGSGFMNVKDPDYSEYLKDFRRIFLNGFCRYCAVKHDSSPVGNAWTSISHTNVSYRNPQNLIVLIQRQPGMGRDIIQHNALYSAINNSIEIVNNMFDTSSSKNPKYELAVYRGNESLCETIAMFWTSKIVVAGHGAGIVNTVFSRVNSLLLEITPDRLGEEGKGQIWRANAPFSQSVGLSTHIIVVPHNESAKSDQDIQKFTSISLSKQHIQKLSEIVQDYLIRSHSSQSRIRSFSQLQQITQMVP